MRFWKVQAIGNDFPLVRLEDVETAALPALAISMADRRFGVGGDGLLGVGTDPDGELRLRMFNPDGTEDFCG
ncbi:diaminopimelate epimerase, partial [bacterium]